MTLEEKSKSLRPGESIAVWAEDGLNSGWRQLKDLTTDDIKRMVEALKHYADESNWHTSRDDGIYDDWYKPIGDGYDIAQQALK